MQQPAHEEDASLPVSTGTLPPPSRVQALVQEAYERFRGVDEGENADYYPALARVPRDLFGICLAGVNGASYVVGDVEHPFTIMSVSKPFVFALVCQQLGPEAARVRLGANATGLPFNSVAALDQRPGGVSNPMVNSGAIAATSLIPGATAEERWAAIVAGLARFAGRELTLDAEVYASASASNQRNRGIAGLLESHGLLGCDPETAVDLYTRQCALQVTVRDLAVMAATLADGGVNPVTLERVVDADVCRRTLAQMATAGMYETSGDWLYDVGLPGKSGVGGGVITVAPGKGGLGVFAPPLDAAGNSVKGQLVSRYLSQWLGLDLFLSRPAQPIG